jgi:hypothetical protein
MVLSMQPGEAIEIRKAFLRALPRALTLSALLVVLVALATTYLGSSSSPYGLCYAPSGRTVPCAAVSDDR